MSQIQMAGTPKLLAVSGIVSATAGTLLGFYVNSTGGTGTVVIRDGSTVAGTAVSGTITPTIGWYDFPAYMTSGCFAEIANTISVTFIFAAG